MAPSIPAYGCGHTCLLKSSSPIGKGFVSRQTKPPVVLAARLADELQGGLAGTVWAAGLGSATAWAKSNGTRIVPESRGAGDVSGTPRAGQPPDTGVPGEQAAPQRLLWRRWAEGQPGAAHGGWATPWCRVTPWRRAAAAPQGRAKAQDSICSKVSSSPAPASRARRDPRLGAELPGPRVGTPRS